MKSCFDSTENDTKDVEVNHRRKKKKPESTEGIILHPNISVLNPEREERMGQESSKE